MSIVTTHDAAPLDLRLASERPGVAISPAAALWIGILAPPFLALLNLELSYAMTPWTCRTGDHMLMNLSSALLLSATIAAGIGAARHLKRDWLEDSVLSRPAFMAMIGVLVSGLAAGVIVAQWLPMLFLSTCQ
jgi:hypothetical protein